MEQACYLLEGTAEVEVDGETPLRMLPGDTCFFPARRDAHLPRDQLYPVRLLVIYSPPLCRKSCTGTPPLSAASEFQAFKDPKSPQRTTWIFCGMPSKSKFVTRLSVCAPPFDADYWLEKDHEGGFPHDFHKALADAGWLGIAMPEAYGGAGLGISEAGIDDAHHLATGAGLSGASAVHMNIFGLHPWWCFGSEAQKKRWLPPIDCGA